MLKYIILFLTTIAVHSIDCDAGKFPDSGKCQNCPIHCIECTASNACTTCENGFYLNFATKECLRQEIDNCIEIVESTKKQCKGCAAGYWLKDDNTCALKTFIGCKVWTEGVADQACATAADNYFKKSATELIACSSISENCIQCIAEDECTACKSDFFLANDTFCMLKTKKCSGWAKSEEEACNACPQGFEVNNKDCVASQCLYKNNNSVKCGNSKTRESAPYCNIPCADIHCLDCINQSNSCQVCDSGFSVVSGACNLTSAIAHCKRLNSDNADICAECEENFKVVDNKCAAVIANCKNYATGAIFGDCSECEDGFFKNSDDPKTCTACSNNCKACTSATVCQSCIDGFFLNDDNDQKTCTACSNNCKTCTSATICRSCNAGYWFHPLLLKCDAECGDSERCLDCNSAYEAANCTKCKPEYFILNEKCLGVCHTDCASCNGSLFYNCLSCPNGRWYNPKDHTCTYYCPVFCRVCTEADKNKCTICDDNYNLATDGRCIKDDYMMDHCAKMANYNDCETCDSTHTLTTDKKCILTTDIIANCAVMATLTTCGTCNSHYHVAADQLSCVECGAHCTECDTSGKTCTECEEGYFVDIPESAQNAICVSCSDYYKYEGEPCEYTDGWRKFPYKCHAFSAGCSESNPTPVIGVATEDCKTCKTGFKLDYTNKNCTTCPSNCLDCFGANACDECEDGYYLNDSFECIICDDTTCQKCSKTECLDCKPNYGFQTGASDDKTKCAACSANCVRCDEPSTCIQCKTGWYLKTEGTGETVTLTCTACSIGCNDCDDDTKCYSCKDGYSLDETSEQCVDKCKKYDETNICTECQTGYYLDETSKQCVDKCKKYDETNICTECKTGYYLDNTICEQCVDHCLSCEDGKSCEECQEDYEWQSEKKECAKKSSTSEETECWSIANCILCKSSDSSKCALCATGSVPFENKCICGDDDKILIDGKCVSQDNELPEDFSKKELDEIAKLVAVSQKNNKEENAKKVLARIKTIIEDDQTAENAKIALSLLVKFSESATDSEAEKSFKSILMDSCSVSDLEQVSFLIAFVAADKFMTTASNSKEIYEIGFKTCLKNLLKKDDIEEVLEMKLTNSQLAMIKIVKSEGEKDIELTGIKVSLNENFLDSLQNDVSFGFIQAINIDANPFKNESTNKVEIFSKIVSVSIFGEDAKEQAIELAENKAFPIKFDATDSKGKCAYYNTENKKWVAEGKIDNKICSFGHLTEFAIVDIQDDIEAKSDDDDGLSGVMIAVIVLASVFGAASILLVLVYFFYWKKKKSRKQAYLAAKNKEPQQPNNEN